MKTAAFALFLATAGLAHMNQNDPGFVIVATLAAIVAIGELTRRPTTRDDLRANSKWWR